MISTGLNLNHTNQGVIKVKEDNKNKTATRTKVKKRPLPVGLDDAQHTYLEETGQGKAEYMRNLLVIDMAKAAK